MIEDKKYCGKNVNGAPCNLLVGHSGNCINGFGTKKEEIEPTLTGGADTRERIMTALDLRTGIVDEFYRTNRRIDALEGYVETIQEAILKSQQAQAAPELINRIDHAYSDLYNRTEEVFIQIHRLKEYILKDAQAAPCKHPKPYTTFQDCNVVWCGHCGAWTYADELDDWVLPSVKETAQQPATESREPTGDKDGDG